MSSVRRAAVLAVVLTSFLLPASARANGDPASDFLLAQNVFLPFNAKVDAAAAKRLNDMLASADKAGFKIKTAVILGPGDLGTAFSLIRKPQRYAEFLGLELSFVYRQRLLVVMPNGFGYSVKGNPDPKAARILETIPPPGADVTKEVQAATLAVRRLAAAEGHRLVVSSGGGSQARDRLTIAAAATLAIAAFAGFVLYRRRRG
jgi:hypothetical protein